MSALGESGVPSQGTASSRAKILLLERHLDILKTRQVAVPFGSKYKWGLTIRQVSKKLVKFLGKWNSDR